VSPPGECDGAADAADTTVTACSQGGDEKAVAMPVANPSAAAPFGLNQLRHQQSPAAGVATLVAAIARGSANAAADAAAAAITAGAAPLVVALAGESANAVLGTLASVVGFGAKLWGNPLAAALGCLQLVLESGWNVEPIGADGAAARDGRSTVAALLVDSASG